MSDPFVALMRRYVNDYTNRQDTSVCAEIMEPEYELRMGPHRLAGRDDRYVPAAVKQFEQFPGLCLTVHEIVCSGERLAMRFSEHGRSIRHDGARAAWSGIGLYRWNGQRLVSNSVEQDYLARQRQLRSGRPASVESPALAPWDTPAVAADPEAEAAVRAWLDAEDDGGSGVILDDGDRQPLLGAATTVVDDIFSAGDRVAFRVTRTGTYAGGLEGDAGRAVAGAAATLHLAGIVTVADGRVASGRIVRDRLGLARRLAADASTGDHARSA